MVWLAALLLLAGPIPALDLRGKAGPTMQLMTGICLIAAQSPLLSLGLSDQIETLLFYYMNPFERFCLFLKPISLNIPIIRVKSTRNQ